MWKRYECPSNPSFIMFGKGGKKAFHNGSYVTDDEEKQATIETSDRFGVTITLAAEGEIIEEVYPQAATMNDHLAALEAERAASTPPDVRVNKSKGDIIITNKKTPPAPPEDLPDPNELTPEQRIKFAFLNAGFDKGTDMDVVLEEMGIDLSLDPIQVADLVEEKLEPLRKQVQSDGGGKTPGSPDADPDIPGKTEIHRMNLDGLVNVAKKHHIPNTTPIMASAKRLKAHIYNHFYGDEKAEE